jgi:DNA-binding transcriptional MerR regulator
MANKIVNGSEVISSGEAAKILGIPRDTLFWMARHGLVPSQQTDRPSGRGHRRYQRAAVEKLAAQRADGLDDDLTIARELIRQAGKLLERHGMRTEQIVI